MATHSSVLAWRTPGTGEPGGLPSMGSHTVGHEEGLSRSLSGGGGKPSGPSPSAGDLRELPRVPLRGEGSCGVGGDPRDSTGSGAMEDT